MEHPSSISSKNAFDIPLSKDSVVVHDIAARSKRDHPQGSSTHGVEGTAANISEYNVKGSKNTKGNDENICNQQQQQQQQQTQSSYESNSTTILVHDGNSNSISNQEKAWRGISTFDKGSDNVNQNPPVNFLTGAAIKRKSSLQSQQYQNNVGSAAGTSSNTSPSKQMKLLDENSQSNPTPLPTQKNTLKNYFNTTAFPASTSTAAASSSSSSSLCTRTGKSRDNPVVLEGSNSCSSKTVGSNGNNFPGSMPSLSNTSSATNGGSNGSGSKHTAPGQQPSNQPVSSIDDQRKINLMEQKIQRLESDLNSAHENGKKLSDQNTKLRKSLEDVYRSRAQQEMRRRRDRLASDSVRIGKLVTQRTGPTSVADVWEEGWALKEMNRRSAELLVRKEELEKRRKRLASEKRKRKGVNTGSGSFAGDQDESGQYDQSSSVDRIELDILAEDSAIKYHSDELRRDSEALSEEKKVLESEKGAHIKEIKRCLSEDRSRFTRDLPCLNGRYVLTSLLGRGGFSEVWKAFDLTELRDVAVKVHQLNNAWNDDRKQSYIKHVTREYEIHGKMQHPRVVSMYDVFEIDVNSFATVLEYCQGTDLDEKLKRMKSFVEKDAKTILFQILSGLRYLHEFNIGSINNGSDGAHDPNQKALSTVTSSPSSLSVKKSIIHYDLKPANILFDEMGDAKITDFGLSKIIDSQSEGTSMELTSQGAGTYWYLPPECFEENARISTKVDVWSMGVIFYQMLFGKRPFGEGRSQERILQEGIIRLATQVNFPDTPKVSEEAKDFIRMCLTANQSLRPDIAELINHKYVKNH